MAETYKAVNNPRNIIKDILTEPENQSAPDGGYGWIILTASLFYQALIPSLISAFGIYFLFYGSERSTLTSQKLWDNEFIYVPFTFITTWTLTDAVSHKLSTSSDCPRLMATVTTCLLSSGILFLWCGINFEFKIQFFILSGFISGFASSLILTQTELLLVQYFKLKLRIVRLISYVIHAVGFIITPVILGQNFLNYGLSDVTLWYQAILLQGLVVNIVFKKADYLKQNQVKFKLIRSLWDEEEDIFTRSCELQNRISKKNDNNQTSSSLNSVTTISSDIFSQTALEFSINTPSSSGNSSSDIDILNDNNVTINSEVRTPQDGWEKFDSGSTTSIQSQVRKNFVTEMNTTTQKPNAVDTPKPNKSFESNNDDEYVIYALPHLADPWKHYKSILKSANTYKALLTMITTQYSLFIFWTLFPSYFYVHLTSVKVHKVSEITGCLGIGVLMVTFLALGLKPFSKCKNIWVGLESLMGTLGYILILHATTPNVMVFGALNVALSIRGLQISGIPLWKLHLKGNAFHTVVGILTGFAFILFLTHNFRYDSCFKLMADLHLINGVVWLSSSLFLKIMKASEK